MNTMKICSKEVGEKHPSYFIADIGANHNGNLDKAFELIHLAKEAGAHAAKFQNFQAAKIVSAEGFSNLKTAHQAKWKKSVFEIYQDASISMDWTPLLKEECDKVGIDYFSSPYDFESVDHLEQFVDVYKVGSGDITWLEMLEYIAKKNKPLLIATGACNIGDVQRAINAVKNINNNIVLMQCNTNYTADLENFKYINLKVLESYKVMYPEYVLGLSDHTPSHATVLGAIALGARVIEKHFTDNNDQDGPDHKFAMNPQSWREMVDRAQELEYALGSGEKKVEENEMDSVIVQQRCLRASRDLPQGHVLTEDDIVALRPMSKNSLSPFQKDMILGRKISRETKNGEHFDYREL